MTNKVVVISGVNMVEGGIFTILDNCLQKISIYNQNKNLRIIALVNDKTKFDYPNIEYIAFPKSKKYWILRFYYEYFYFKTLSKEIKPDIWLSLHDMSPNVIAKKRFVYCHHPTIFYKPTLKDWRFNFKIGLFSVFYKYLYQINIKKNDAIFVQQNWIKKEFELMFNLTNVIVSKPEFVSKTSIEKLDLEDSKVHFFYPLISKSFKNIELIGEAIRLLPETTQSKIKIHITIQKGDSKYSDHILSQYKLEALNYIGKISQEAVFAYYNSMDCLLFTSKLETWGLPISEAKAFKKPMLLANLPYAKEAVGDYDKVSFFDINSSAALAELITKFANETIVFEGNTSEIITTNQVNSWDQLFEFILKEK